VGRLATQKKHVGLILVLVVVIKEVMEVGMETANREEMAGMEIEETVVIELGLGIATKTMLKVVMGMVEDQGVSIVETWGTSSVSAQSSVRHKEESLISVRGKHARIQMSLLVRSLLINALHLCYLILVPTIVLYR
ncbi:hypothetical protein QUT20_22615, partial [Xanthomonas citri pv. citri]